MGKTPDRPEAVRASGSVRAAIVASRWNEGITRRLVEGARSAMLGAGVAADRIELFWVSGSFELPQAAEALARDGRYDAIVPLGCLIRGETPHFDVLARVVAQGLEAVARRHRAALSFGVLTCDTHEQAQARAGGVRGNKGEEAALAALDLVPLKKERFRA